MDVLNSYLSVLKWHMKVHFIFYVLVGISHDLQKMMVVPEGCQTAFTLHVSVSRVCSIQLLWHKHMECGYSFLYFRVNRYYFDLTNPSIKEVESCGNEHDVACSYINCISIFNFLFQQNMVEPPMSSWAMLFTLLMCCNI